MGLETSQVFGGEAATPVGLETSQVFSGDAATPVGLQTKGAGQAGQERVGPLKGAFQASEWGGLGDPEWGRPSSRKGFAGPEKVRAGPGEEAGRAPDRTGPGPGKRRDGPRKVAGPDRGGPGLRWRRLALRRRLAATACAPCGVASTLSAHHKACANQLRIKNPRRALIKSLVRTSF